jgi:predicted  nucleic acid-binding Zn-ribbon protein
MHRLAPATRIRLVEATARLQKLRREMARLSKGDKDYEKKKLALQAVIKELRSGRHASESKTRKATSAQALTQLSHEGRQASSSRSRAKKFLSS